MGLGLELGFGVGKGKGYKQKRFLLSMKAGQAAGVGNILSIHTNKMVAVMLNTQSPLFFFSLIFFCARVVAWR